MNIIQTIESIYKRFDFFQLLSLALFFAAGIFMIITCVRLLIKVIKDSKKPLASPTNEFKLPSEEDEKDLEDAAKSIFLFICVTVVVMVFALYSGK